MQAQKVIGLESEGGIRPAAVIAELHFEDLGTEDLHNRAHLSADETGFGYVAHQRYSPVTAAFSSRFLRIFINSRISS